jgi:hypothetical protein
VKLTTHLYLMPRSNNPWSDTSTPPTRLHGVVLFKKKKHRDFAGTKACGTAIQKEELKTGGGRGIFQGIIPAFS